MPGARSAVTSFVPDEGRLLEGLSREGDIEARMGCGGLAGEGRTHLESLAC